MSQNKRQSVRDRRDPPSKNGRTNKERGGRENHGDRNDDDVEDKKVLLVFFRLIERRRKSFSPGLSGQYHRREPKADGWDEIAKQEWKKREGDGRSDDGCERFQSVIPQTIHENEKSVARKERDTKRQRPGKAGEEVVVKRRTALSKNEEENWELNRL